MSGLDPKKVCESLTDCAQPTLSVLANTAIAAPRCIKFRNMRSAGRLSFWYKSLAPIDAKIAAATASAFCLYQPSHEMPLEFRALFHAFYAKPRRRQNLIDATGLWTPPELRHGLADI